MNQPTRPTLTVAAIAVVIALLAGAALANFATRGAAHPVDTGADSFAAPAANRTQFLRNTQRAKITRAIASHEPIARGGTLRMAVEVEMLPGMHVNANPPTHDWMIPVQVSLAGVDGVNVVEAFYPEAESRKFPYDEEPYLVYEGTFVVALMLGVAADIPPGGRELEVVLDYQACNDEACFAPAKTSITLPVMIVTDRAQSNEVDSDLLEKAPFPGR